ncbi:hypothetical protein ACPCG0_03565 [Propionibacteriaceae bacterium Y1923]
MTTHIDPRLWERYAAGTLPDAAADALEGHVVDCPNCQAQTRLLAGDPAPLWQAVHTRIATPRPSPVLRFLQRLGLRDEDAVVLAASGDLRLPWAVAVGGAMACMILTGTLVGYREALFILLAPIVPPLAVAAAHEATDPLRELTGALPHDRLRLTLLRTLAALAVALPTMGLLAVAMPPLRPMVGDWPIPALALTGFALLLLDRLPVRITAPVMVGAWLAVVAMVATVGALDRLVSTTGQVVFLLVGAACVGGLVASTRGSSLVPARSIHT